MSVFFGSNAGETITPDLVSPTVNVHGRSNLPSAEVDVIFAGGGNDTVAGGGGNDRANLGAGDDTFVWNPGDGNDFVDGEAGSDRLIFNGSAAAENITVSAGSHGLAQVTRDVGDVTMDLNSVERIEIAALDGQDRITVNDLSHTDVTDVDINLAGAANSNAGDGQGDTVIVNGTQANDQIAVVSNGSSAVVSGLCATTTIDHIDAGVDQLLISGGGGDDRIDASVLPASSILLTLDGGDGNDTLIGGGGADMLLGGDGNDLVIGGRGNDVAFLGAGDDTFVWNPGDGSDTVEGGAGADTMLFNGANINEKIDISANGGRVLFHRDVASISMDLNGVEQVDFTALGGADNITVNDLSGTDVTQVNIDLAGVAGSNVGDGQQDQVTIVGTAGNDAITVAQNGDAVIVQGRTEQVTIEHAEVQNDMLVINAGAGDDTIDASGLGAGLIGVQLQGGDGADTLIGSAGNDVLLGGAGDDVLTGGVGDDQMFGQAGNDRMIWNPGEGTDLMEGGAGEDTAEVNGGNGAETFTITANGTRVRFDRVTPAPFSLDIGTTEHLVLNANGGDDVISAGNGLSTLIQLTIDGGAGNDTITGGDGADMLLGGDGNDLVNGGRGSDTAILGAGDDTFVWNPGDGSDVVDGGTGTDTMLFNGANINERMDISANGERARFTRDVANITMDVNDVEHIHFNALGGADNITVNDLSGTDVTQVAIDLAGVVGSNVGDAQQDQVNVLGTAGNDAITVAQNGDAVIVQGLAAQVTIEHAEAQNDTLIINAGAGDDTIDASGLGAGVIGVQLQGGDGADQLIGSAGNDLVFGGRGNDVALLGAGDDTFVWNPGDGNDVVEGGTGTDTMLFNGANITENIDISANGGRALFHRDAANINMDLNGVEHIDFTALGGADNIVVNDLSGTDVSQVNIDLAATLGGTAGDNQVDTVEIKGTSGNDVIKLSLRDGALVVGGLAEEVVIKNFDLTDAIHIEGLGGDDVIDASALGVGAPQITLDGGTGDDVLLGGAGNDTLLGGAGDDVLLGGAGVDVLDGGPGNNTVIQDIATPGTNTAVSTFGDGGDIFAHGQVTIEDFQASPGGAAVEGGTANAQIPGSDLFPGFGAGEQMAFAPVDVASMHADNLLM